MRRHMAIDRRGRVHRRNANKIYTHVVICHGTSPSAYAEWFTDLARAQRALEQTINFRESYDPEIIEATADEDEKKKMLQQLKDRINIETHEALVRTYKKWVVQRDKLIEKLAYLEEAIAVYEKQEPGT